MRLTEITHEFVEFVPAELEEGKLYISLEYAGAVHLCACGCRTKVVTPLSPAEWQLIFDGDSVSLYPSIGNWQFPCQSHYWIRRNVIDWARRWSQREIERGQQRDEADLAHYYEGRLASSQKPESALPAARESVTARIKRHLRVKT